ncbi:MAG: hypothetical protein ACO31Z_06555, partial [Litorivicinaceae bacterium]
MKQRRAGIVLGTLLVAATASATTARDASIAAMADRLAAQGVDRGYVLDVMAQAKTLDSVLNA